MQANATVSTVAQSTPGTWTDLVIAITTLVSILSGLVVHYINSPRIKAASQLAKSTADKVIEGKEDIATLAKVTYNMLPEEAAKITDANNVRIAALEEKIRSANTELGKLKGQAPG